MALSQESKDLRKTTRDELLVIVQDKRYDPADRTAAAATILQDIVIEDNS